MANRFWVNGGNGNWNSTTNWSASSGGVSGASVPGVADDAFFDANGNSNANAATTGLSVRSITFASGYTSNFSVTFGSLAVTTYLEFSPNMTTSGNNTLSIQGGQLKTNGLVINVLFQFSSNGTIQLLDNCTATNLVINPVTSMTLNGFAINAIGSLTLSAANQTIPTLGTTVLNINGTGNQTITNNNGTIGLPININKASGTLTIPNFNVGYGCVLTYIAGTVVHTGALQTLGSITLNTSGISWNGWNIGNATTHNITFTSTFTMTGTLLFNNTVISTTNFMGAGFFTSCGNISYASTNNTTVNLINDITTGNFSVSGVAGVKTLNGANILINGNLTMTAGITGNATLIMSGTGIWSGANAVGCNLTFNTSGTITISSTVTYGRQGSTVGTITYTAGSIISSSGTLSILGGTWNTSGVVWANLLCNSNNTIMNLISDINCVDWQINNVSLTVNGIGFKVRVSGNLNQSNQTTIAPTGDASICLAGTGTWSANHNTTTALMTLAVDINTLGTITLGGSIHLHDTTLTFTQGIINPDASTVIITGTINSNNTGLNFNILTFDGNITNIGTHGWTTNQLVCTTGTHTYKAGNTYVINNLLQLIGTALARIVMLSDSSGNQAFFNLLPGGTMTIGYVTATDINSSGGITIWNWQGILNNTVNWRELLPPSTVGYTFWN